MAKVHVVIKPHRAFFTWLIAFSFLAAQGREQGLDGTKEAHNQPKTSVTENCQPEERKHELKVRTVDIDECNGEEDVEHRLMSKLLKGYNKNARPVKNKRESIQVEFDLAYNQLVDLDGKRQTLTSKVWIRQLWRNSLLTWNKTKYCNITKIQLEPQLVWKPDVVLYNSIGITSSGEMYKFDTKVILHYDGKNEWFAPTEIKSICHIDIAYFPFDYQSCYLKFGSWTHGLSTMNFTMQREGSADLSMYYINGEWELLGVPAIRHVVKYSCCDDPFVDITYKIRLKRRVLFYLNNLVIPNLILAGLVICSFYVPPESGERISLNITIMLGLTVFLLLFNERIPPTSEVVPLIGGYYFALFYQVGISMILTCVTSRCYHHNPFREMPRWFRFLIFRVLAPLFRMQKAYAKDTSSAHRPRQTTDVKCKKHQRLFLYKSANGTLKLKEEPVPGLEPNGEKTHNQNANLEVKMDEIAKQLDVFVNHLKRNEELEAKKDEWHFASIVMDKLFFWLFTGSITLTTMLFYIKILNQDPGSADIH